LIAAQVLSTFAADSIAMNPDETTLPRPSATTSALHYEGAQEPRISGWTVLGLVALVLGIVYYALRLARG
jgi:hypothetical protein